MVDQDDLPWEGQCADAAYTFACDARNYLRETLTVCLRR